MKDFLMVLCLLLIGWLIYSEFFRQYNPPDGWLLISQQSWDSLISVANQPPDTVETIIEIPGAKDTIWIETPVPVPVPHGIVNFYEDRILTNDFALVIKDSIAGELKHRLIGYDLLVPRFIVREITITKPIPVPVVIKEPYKVQPYGYYFLGGMGIGGMSIEGGVVRNERWIVGVQGMKVGGNYYALLKGGMQL